MNEQLIKDINKAIDDGVCLIKNKVLNILRDASIDKKPYIPPVVNLLELPFLDYIKTIEGASGIVQAEKIVLWMKVPMREKNQIYISEIPYDAYSSLMGMVQRDKELQISEDATYIYYKSLKKYVS